MGIVDLVIETCHIRVAVTGRVEMMRKRVFVRDISAFLSPVLIIFV